MRGDIRSLIYITIGGAYQKIPGKVYIRYNIFEFKILEGYIIQKI
jgi:hypothetical protein